VNHRELFEHAFLSGALDGFRARVMAHRRGERLVSERCCDEVAGGTGGVRALIAIFVAPSKRRRSRCMVVSTVLGLLPSPLCPTLANQPS